MIASSNRNAVSLRDFSVAQLKLIRRSVARNCTDAEFDEFVSVAQQAGLDPLRRQIAPLIVNSADLERRKMIPWATIDGLRVIAARQGDYRPMETPPDIHCDESQVDRDRNPLGIVRAEVVAWKRSDERWHAVAGEAWWDEFAPLREEWTSNHMGQRTTTGKLSLDASWARMGRVMIAKCAEAQALRRGWPDVLSGLYGEEELHSLRLNEETASERMHRHEVAAAGRARGQSAWFIFGEDQQIALVPRAAIFARVEEFLRKATTAAAIEAFQDRNKLSLTLFWEWEPRAAHEIKQLSETRLTELKAAERERKRSPLRKRKRTSEAKLSTKGAGREDATSPRS